MKKLLSVLLTVTMVILFVAGCGNGNNAKSGSEKDESSKETTSENEESGEGDAGEDNVVKKVGFTVPSIGNDFMLSIVETVQEALEAEGVECQVDSADSDVTKQIEQIENYATMGMDLIIVLPINGEALTSVCNNVMDQGIPVFAYAMEIPDGATTQMLAAEEYDMGKASAEIASDWIDKNFSDAGDGEVKVYLLSSSYSPELAKRCDGMRETIEENSKVTLVEEQIADSNNSNEARTKIENAFLSYPDIDVVIAANGPSALGIDSYIISADSPVEDLSKFAIFTVDETEEIDTKIKISVDNKSALRGTISMGNINDIVYKDFMPAVTPILKGEEPIEVWNGSYGVVTAETMAEKE